MREETKLKPQRKIAERFDQALGLPPSPRRISEKNVWRG
jgi:hypothetical protein